MTAKQLTDSILQLAIQGQLVPQDPHDEPASSLLEKIRDEKSRLVKEGVLKKKDFEETPVDEKEEPFNIPDNWMWVRINTIMAVLDSRRKPVTKSDRETGIYPYCGANGILDYVKDYIFDGKFILVGEDGSVITKGGKPVVNRIEGKIWVNNHAHIIQEYAGLGYQDYIYYALQATDITKYVHGFMPKYSQGDLRDTAIPLPPLAEQRRIVERIEEILPFVKEYGEAYEEASKMDAELPDKLKKSILQDAIMGKLGTQDPNDEPASVLLEQIREEKKRLVKEGVLKKKDLEETPVDEEEEPFKIPESWMWVRVSDIVNVLMGQSPDGNDVYEADNGDGAYEFHQGKICFTDKYIAPSGKWCKTPARIASANSLLVCVRAPIGDVNITQRTIGIGRGLSAIKGFNNINTDFLYFWMKAHKRCLVDQGTGSTFKAITVDVLRNQPIPLPPLAEQLRIVQMIEELYAEIDNMAINNVINETEIKETENE